MSLRVVMTVILVLGEGTLASRLIAQPAGQKTDRPNVLLIMMDDIGYGDIGSYGVSDAKTPNLDRLAGEGVRLTDAYANGPVCTPTRAALITGRYQQRVGLEGALTDTQADHERGLPAAGTSLPALLRKNGYVTGLVGKWHLGSKPEFGPNAHGFDEFFGFLGGAHDYYRHTRADGTSDLYENSTPVSTTTYLTDEITQRAVRFIDRHAARPFFLEVAYNAVHWPFQPPDLPVSDPRRDGNRPLRQMPDSPHPATRGDYVRMLERADDGVGAILAALERSGVAQNTLVIFTNDNGGEWLSRNAPLHHRKGTIWEGGIRVPLILRWPGRLPRGATSKQVAITLDLTASILAATGTAVPAEYRPEGIDILPSLARQVPLIERQLFWRILRPERTQKAARSGRWKLLADGGVYLLFDLDDDPGERHDLAAEHRDRVVTIKALLTAWEADVDQKSVGR
jgi:arylsulfatase A-like enzyme